MSVKAKTVLGCMLLTQIVLPEAQAAPAKEFSCSVYTEKPYGSLSYSGRFRANDAGYLSPASEQKTLAKEIFKASSSTFASGVTGIGDNLNIFSQNFGAEYDSTLKGKAYIEIPFALMIDRPPSDSGDTVSAKAIIKKGAIVVASYATEDAWFYRSDERKRSLNFKMVVEDPAVMPKLSGELDVSISMASKTVASFKYNVTPRNMRAFVDQYAAQFSGKVPSPTNCVSLRN